MTKPSIDDRPPSPVAAIDISNPMTWPLRMRRTEVASVLRLSPRSLFDRIRLGRFPPPDDGHTWTRATVQHYAEGGVRKYEEQAARQLRRLKVAR